jgi:hypothetical protein
VITQVPRISLQFEQCSIAVFATCRAGRSASIRVPLRQTAAAAGLPSREILVNWDCVGDYVYAVAFASLAAASILNLANLPAFVYFQE